MRIRFRELVTFEADAGGAGAGSAGGAPGASGQQPGQQQPGQQQPGAGAGGQDQSPAPRNLAEAAARAAAAGAGQQQNNQQQPGDQPPASTPYYPEGLAEPLRGQNDRETIDKLMQEVGGRPKPPATANDYKLELDADFTKKFGDLKDDPVLPVWRQVAFEMGLDNAQFQGAIPKLFAGMEKAGLIAPPFDIEAEHAKLAPGEHDPIQRSAKSMARVNEVAGFVQGMLTRKEINKAEASRLAIMFSDAENVMVFEKILGKIPKEHGPQGNKSGAAPQGDSKQSIIAEMGDPRYDSLSPKFDPAYRKRVDDDWKRLHGAN